MRRARTFALALAAAFAASASLPLLATGNPDWAPEPFEVSYAVTWKGIQAGTTAITLVQSAPGQWTYSSKNIARGLVKAIVPGTATQVSEFVVVDGEVRPVRFRGDDGGKATDRDTSLDFDWQKGRITGTSEGHAVDLPIPPNMQDVMSVQIAQMRAAQTGTLPMTFHSIDKGQMKEYVFQRAGDPQTIKTAIGDHQVIPFTSQRSGSSRLLKLWVAPDLGWIPLRAERLRDGKIEFTMDVRTLNRP